MLFDQLHYMKCLVSPRWISDSPYVTWICLVMQHVYRSRRSSDHWLLKDGAFSSDSQSWRSLQTEHIKHINLLNSKSLRGERQDLSIVLKTQPKRAWEKNNRKTRKECSKLPWLLSPFLDTPMLVLHSKVRRNTTVFNKWCSMKVYWSR